MFIRLFVFFFSFCFFVQSAQALGIVHYKNMPVKNDWIMGPAKVELVLEPGESITREIKVSNRMGKSMEMIVDIEDFTGDNKSVTRLLGDEKGPYSLRNYLHPEVMNFQLAHGERASLPIEIKIPEDAQPGGLYGSVLINARSLEEKEAGKEGINSQISVVSRIGVLFFIRVKGDIETDGRIKTFDTDKNFYKEAPVNFNMTYDNTGTIYLSPHGVIEIRNFLGKKVDEIEVNPWFVMPGFLRSRSVAWKKDLAIGKYTAHLNLNRGYEGKIDTAKVSFWIIPIKTVLSILAIILSISIFIWWFGRTFEFKRKK